MNKIAIITDTDSSLPASIAKEFNIRQVPITIHFENENYTTGLDLDDQRVFELIDQYKKLPTTAAPSPAAFAKAFEAAFDEGAEAVICLCVSSKISSTYNSAQQACELLPGKEVIIVDTLDLTMGQGFMSVAAAKAAKDGASVEEVLTIIDNMRSRLHTFGALPTLKYLAMGGRVGKLAAGMADTLNIKPILTTNEGKLDLLEKVRTNRKAINRVVELTKETMQGKRIEQIAIIHTNNVKGAKLLEENLRSAIECPEEITIAEFTPGLSVHAGAGFVGVVVLEAV
jgi:DegV family protein with EDD domain